MGWISLHCLNELGLCQNEDPVMPQTTFQTHSYLTSQPVPVGATMLSDYTRRTSMLIFWSSFSGAADSFPWQNWSISMRSRSKKLLGLCFLWRILSVFVGLVHADGRPWEFLLWARLKSSRLSVSVWLFINPRKTGSMPMWPIFALICPWKRSHGFAWVCCGALSLGRGAVFQGLLKC